MRRGSRLVGTCEGAWWRPTPRAEARRVLLAAKRYELAGRQAGVAIATAAQEAAGGSRHAVTLPHRAGARPDSEPPTRRLGNPYESCVTAR